MAHVKAKLVKFLMKDENHEYITDQETISVPAQEVMRAEVYISPEELAESQASVQTTGMMYVEIVEE